ncbi:uncharacterized protein LOC143907319 [Temnothorax americanus]|uniref:uncharacterized protein LOC143907319 n=1 Tax=Temnothorax americanus TaxID=1964332 RepID=UPI004068820A
MVELTEDKKREFRLVTRCHVCGKSFQPEDKRVRDHCHLTGRYRGPAHSRCNLNYRNVYVIPVFFHNLSGYDAHFVVEKIANEFEGGVNLLLLTKESYIFFSKTVKETQTDGGWDRYVKLRFVDSYKFLAASIETLASYLNKNKLRITRSEYADLSVEDLDLLTRKGVFPYEYVDSVDKLRETELPPREVFYSSLTDETASESDYEHATSVWRRFRVRDLGEYSDLYLKTDVLLLANIVENFRDAKSVFSENLVAIELRRLEVKFNKPVYVGMCILEISKTRLYEFHYDYMLPLYRDRCRIFYTDTDSLIYSLECENAHERMRRDIDRFDTSDYTKNNAHGMPRVNKKVPGLMKDENNGAIMTEFVGLRAKMYTYRVLGRDDTKRIKGVKRNVVAKKITFEDYVACLRNARELKTHQSCIRSTLHEVYTVSEQKLALSPHDDKRYVTSNGEVTLPWGHYKIPL